MYKATIKLANLLLTVMISTLAHGLESDVSAPIQIKANHASFDQNKGFALYNGDVKLSQGSIAITADKIKVIAVDGRLNRAIISGETPLASFSQQTDAGKKIIGKAQQITLHQQTADITFEGNASIDDGLNTITGPIIHYNSKTHSLKASQTEGDEGQVKMIFLPANSEQESKDAE